jgi:O-antigen ligase
MNPLRFPLFLLKCLSFFYSCFFLSLFIGQRAICSICEAAILLCTLLLFIAEPTQKEKIFLPSYFLLGCLIFYLLQILSLFHTTHPAGVVRQLLVQITLVVVPLTFYLSRYLDTSFRAKIMPFYILSMASSLVFCLGIAIFDYSVNHNPSVFFYHSLVKPFDQHAVQFSVFTFAGLVFLLEGARNKVYLQSKFFHYFLISFYLFFIILLSSKLVIAFAFIAMMTYIILIVKETHSLKNRLIPSTGLAVLILFVLLKTNNPVGERFKDIFRGNLNVIEKNQFNPGDYLNGVQFRLIQWKLVSEILHENNAWIFGVSSGESQDLLDKKYLSLNLYVGDRSTQSHGFLGYNTHNELLEAFLQLGIFGLFAFLIICAGFVQMMIYCRKVEFWLIGSLIIIYSFVESVFQTQYGLLLFIFLPLFLFYTTDHAESKQPHIRRI